VAQVAEIVDRFPPSTFRAVRCISCRGEKALLCRSAVQRAILAAITEAQVLTAKCLPSGAVPPYGIRRLNHGIVFSHAAIELLLPTYCEKLGLKGASAPTGHSSAPRLIPAIESGWVGQIHTFGSEWGLLLIRARSDIYFKRARARCVRNRPLLPGSGLYACYMFIFLTLIRSTCRGIPSSPGPPRALLASCVAPICALMLGTPAIRARLAAGGQGCRPRRPATPAARPASWSSRSARPSATERPTVR